MKIKLNEQVTLGTAKYIKLSLTRDQLDTAVANGTIEKGTTEPTLVNKFNSYIFTYKGNDTYIDSGEGIKEEAVNALAFLVNGDTELDQELTKIYNDNKDQSFYSKVLDYVDNYQDEIKGTAYQGIDLNAIKSTLSSTEIDDKTFYATSSDQQLTDADAGPIQELVTAPKAEESTDAGATSGIHVSSGQLLKDDDTNSDDKKSKDEEATDLDNVVLKDLDFKEGLFIRKFNRMVKKFYEDDDMKDYAVPQVMDINDASLDDEGNLTLAVSLQYDDGDVKDSVITIKGFTGDSGTYSLQPAEDVVDVDDGDIQADVDVNDKNESVTIKSLSYDIDIKGSKVNKKTGLSESFLITKIGKE